MRLRSYSVSINSDFERSVKTSRTQLRTEDIMFPLIPILSDR
nr:hypothetical protein [Nostoc sp. CreGUA01]